MTWWTPRLGSSTSADGPNAGEFAKPIEATRSLIVPTLSLLEVFKRIAHSAAMTRRSGP